MAMQFKSLVTLLIDKRLKGKSGIYKTEERERLGLKLAVPKPKNVVAGPSTNVKLWRLLNCSWSKSKLEVPVIWSLAPESMTQGSRVVRQAVEVPFWAKVAVESNPTELECRDKMRLYSSSGIKTILDFGRSDCEDSSSLKPP